MSTLDQGRMKQSVFIIILLILGLTIFYELRAFLSGFLGAVTLYALLRKPMLKLTEKHHFPKALAAVLLVIASILLIFLPLGAIAQTLFAKLSGLQINSNQVQTGVEAIFVKIEEYTGIELMSSGTLAQLQSVVGSIVQTLLNTTYNLVINGIMLCLFLYFMLTNVRSLDASVRQLLPFTAKHSTLLIDESKKMVVSNAVGIPFIAILQGLLAAGGYWIFGVSDPLFWGLITGVCGILPIAGSAIIWAPMGAYMLVYGEAWQGIGILLFGIVVITSSDNLIRFMLQKRMANVHPLVTLLGVIIGVNLFGFLGLIFGPLLLSIFMLLIKIYRYEYMGFKEPEKGVKPEEPKL